MRANKIIRPPDTNSCAVASANDIYNDDVTANGTQLVVKPNITYVGAV
jgi:hypothetical protein